MQTFLDKIVNGINQWLQLRPWAKISSLVGLFVVSWLMLGLFFGAVRFIMMPFSGMSGHNQARFDGGYAQQGPRFEGRGQQGGYNQTPPNYGGYQQQPYNGGYNQAPPPPNYGYQQPYDGGYYNQAPYQGGYQQPYQGGYNQAPPPNYGYQQPYDGGYAQQAPQFEGRGQRGGHYDQDSRQDRRGNFGPLGILFFLIGGLFRLACLAGVVGLGAYAFNMWRNRKTTPPTVVESASVDLSKEADDNPPPAEDSTDEQTIV